MEPSITIDDDSQSVKPLSEWREDDDWSCLQSAVAHPQRWRRRCIGSSGTSAALQFPNSVTLNGE